MKGSWDVFLFNTEKSTKGVVLTEKGYKLRETNDERRMTRDEGRETRDERRIAHKLLKGSIWRSEGGVRTVRGVGAVEVTNNDLEI